MTTINIRKLMILALLPSLAFVAQSIAMDPQNNQQMASTAAAQQQAFMAELIAADQKRQNQEDGLRVLGILSDLNLEAARSLERANNPASEYFRARRQLLQTRPEPKATERLRRPSANS